LDNALKNTREGSVEVGISGLPGDEVQIRVSDTGKGISKTFQKRMFEPFVREKENGMGNHGLGLGLTLAREFTKLINGDLEIHSLPGEGTEAKLTIGVK
jgi:signal transduction histidine kinase